MRKTKIVCTIGPASSNEETLTAMCLAGMNVARLNFSHGSHKEHQERIDLIKKVREKLGLHVAIMLDTKGPEYRIRTFEGGSAYLEDNSLFTFTTQEVQGNNEIVSVNYQDLPHELVPGDSVLLADGLISLKVMEVTEFEVICKVISGGTITDRKSMNFPGKVLKQKYLSDVDKEDILFGIKNEIDFLACSFVSCKQDVQDVKVFLLGNGGKNINIVCKIENRSGVDNYEEICQLCDGIMIGRGDMGVEIPFEELPAIQKKLITTGRIYGKKVITATEMLESMITNQRPTRAEISDVANAVYDGTSAVMLSGETAMGKHPALVVETMAKIALETEGHIHYDKRFKNFDFSIVDMTDAVSHAACNLAISVNAKVIASCTNSGLTASMISRFRSPADILGLTPEPRTARKLALSWGVTPVLIEEITDTDALFDVARAISIDIMNLKSGDSFVITGGMSTGILGKTNILKAEHID